MPIKTVLKEAFLLSIQGTLGLYNSDLMPQMECFKKILKVYSTYPYEEEPAENIWKGEATGRKKKAIG